MRQIFKNSSFLLFFLTLFVNLIYEKKIYFLNFFSTLTSDRDSFSINISNDPVVVANGYATFKLYFYFFNKVLILKNYFRNACFDHAPRELSTFLVFFNRVFHNMLIKLNLLCAK